MSDPPVFSTPTVRFDPRARTATVTTVDVEEDERGRERKTRKVARYRLSRGVYVQSRP